MLIELAEFQETESGTFKTEFITVDGHSINVFINMGGAELDEEAVNFARQYLSRELEIRQQAATKVYSENEDIKNELEYSTVEDFYKALEPGSLTVLWQIHETRMAYLSPLDDLELWGENHVILVCYERDYDELSINLEQD